MKLLLSAFFAALFIVFNSCEKEHPPCLTCPPPFPDTTSHNFLWGSQQLGDGSSSALYDVRIISDTLAYAVGEIYLRDSSGQFDPQPYVLAKWNGSKWELRKLYDANGQIISRVRGIVILSPSDIWLADGGVHHWDGISSRMAASWSRILLIGGQENGQSVNKLWGMSSDNLIGVGNKGMATRFDGGSWRKIGTGTTTDINDVWGATNTATQQQEAYCAVTPFLQPGDKKVLKITESGVDSIHWSPGKEVVSIWTPDTKTLYTCGDGVFAYRTGLWTAVELSANSYTNCIRGNTLYDIFVVGDFGLIVHYNGRSWKVFTGTSDASYFSVSVRENTVIAVGARNGMAAIEVGTRH